MPSLGLDSVSCPRRDREVVIRDACAGPLEKWPLPPESLLTVLEQLRLLADYVRRKQAVEFYVEGRRGDYIKDKTGISITKAKRLFERCTARKRDGSVVGFYACLPKESEAPAVKHSRNAAARPFKPELAAEGKGLKGVFTQLLDRNEGRIRKKLDEFFRTRRLGDRAPFPVLTQSVVFKGFLRLCQDEGLTKDDYPFCQKRKGEWSITHYWKWWSAAHARAAANNQYGVDAAKEQDVDMAAANCVELPPLPRPDGYARVELDEHLLHAVGLLTVPCRSGPDIVVGTRRVWGLVLRETGAGAILSTCVAYREKYDKNDVLRLVRKALKAPKPLQHPSLQKLKYLPGAAFPSEAGFELHRWQVTAFDADASHLSIADVGDLRQLLGEIENERVGQPTAHPHAESINARIADFIERMPSGTGNSPEDPARRDPEGAAEKFSIHVTLLEEILDVWARNFNATPQKSLDGRTPLQQLKALQVQGRVFVSAADAFGEFELYKLLPRFEANITFSRSTPKRVGALGAQLFGAWYTSNALAGSAGLRGSTELKCTIYVEDDARYAWVVPHAFPNLKFFVKVTNRDLKDFAHSLEWRRLTEAHGTNAVYEAQAASATTMFSVLESLAERAKAGDQGAAVAVSQFAGFMAQVQNGLLHYVSSEEERRAVDAERPVSSDAPPTPPRPPARAADAEHEPAEQGATPVDAQPTPAPAPSPPRARKAKLLDPVPLQGQTPAKPLPSSRNPFGLKK